MTGVSFIVVLLLTTYITLMEGGNPGDERRGVFTLARGKVLKDHVIAEKKVTSPLQCAFHCKANDKCLSYNYKSQGPGENDVCELNKATRKSSGNLYLDDGQYDHYFDVEGEMLSSCVEYYKHGVRVSGIYTITETKGHSYKVFCDLNSEPGSVWTLFLSYALKNRRNNIFCRRSLAVDAPVNEDSPNWEAYRMSRARLERLASHSSHWRTTAGYNVYGVDYTDYMRGKMSSVNIVSYVGDGVCKDVEFINVRGHEANNTQAYLWQRDKIWAIHFESQLAPCTFKANSDAVSSENDFGFYCEGDFTMNRKFRGAMNEESTTQWWLGSYT